MKNILVHILIYILPFESIGQINYPDPNALRFTSSDLIEIVPKDKKGIKDGKSSIFYPNGELKEQVTYTEGFRIGEYLEFYQNGQLKTVGWYNVYERNYMHDIFYIDENDPSKKQLDLLLSDYFSSKEGTWFYYYPNGNLEKVETYWSEEPLLRTDVSTKIDLMLIIPFFDPSFFMRSVPHGIWASMNYKGILKTFEIYKKGQSFCYFWSFSN